jgi:transcription elongation GreA/GreB family factor
MSSNSVVEMNKNTLLQAIIERLADDLEVARRAAQTAYETATHEENVAENKYDTLGLEASYLATGQARRMEEIRQGLLRFQQLKLREYDDETGVELGALVQLLAAGKPAQWFFLGPEAAGLKVDCEGQQVMVITPLSPLGKSLLGKFAGDDLSVAGLAYQIVDAL